MNAEQQFTAGVFRVITSERHKQKSLGQSVESIADPSEQAIFLSRNIVHDLESTHITKSAHVPQWLPRQQLGDRKV